MPMKRCFIRRKNLKLNTKNLLIKTVVKRCNHSGYGLSKIIKRIKRGSKKFIAIHIDYDVITALCFTKTSICMGYASKILDIKSIESNQLTSPYLD